MTNLIISSIEGLNKIKDTDEIDMLTISGLSGEMHIYARSIAVLNLESIFGKVTWSNGPEALQIKDSLISLPLIVKTEEVLLVNTALTRKCKFTGSVAYVNDEYGFKMSDDVTEDFPVEGTLYLSSENPEHEGVFTPLNGVTFIEGNATDETPY